VPNAGIVLWGNWSSRTLTRFALASAGREFVALGRCAFITQVTDSRKVSNVTFCVTFETGRYVNTLVNLLISLVSPPGFEPGTP
jgi:hypothetical protein